MVKTIAILNVALLLVCFFCAKSNGEPLVMGDVSRDEPEPLALAIEPKVSSSNGVSNIVASSTDGTPIQEGTPPLAGGATPKEFRFDALRIQGTPVGPQAMITEAGLGIYQTPLLKLRRSFIHRIFETVEAPALHGGK
ncbi:MAG: hypothetical protein V1754_04785 [Pseudomonadota bacterium]